MLRIHEQIEFRPELPVIIGNIDYQNFKELLIQIDDILVKSKIELDFIEHQLLKRNGGTQPKIKSQSLFQNKCRIALRCNIARFLTEKEFRKFSSRLADSPLLQWFCLLDKMDAIKVPSKSELERFDKIATVTEIKMIIDNVNRFALNPDNYLGLEKELNLDSYFSDSTCLKANIHFPVDWILLRDGVLTIVKSIKIIRKYGIRTRMPKPSAFLTQINKLSIEMSQCRRKKNAGKLRKKVLRKMKKIAKTVKEHAVRYVEKLEDNWKGSTLSEKEKDQIASRLNNIIIQMPSAIKQAHERIIGERKVSNKDKILSFYEPDTHVIIRGKVNAETEFGNNLFIAEQSEGLIIDWCLEKEQSQRDILLMQNSLERINKIFKKYPKQVGADRGFCSKHNSEWLEDRKIKNGICPKNPATLKKAMKTSSFRKLHKRRAQTESRIAILKNQVLKCPLKSKGFNHRELSVGWAVLTHNLWVLARLPKSVEKLKQKAA